MWLTNDGAVEGTREKYLRYPVSESLKAWPVVFNLASLQAFDEFSRDPATIETSTSLI